MLRYLIRCRFARTRLTGRHTEASVISIHHLQKRFGYHRVLRDVNLELGTGEFVCLFGANGAGKTTLLRILATLSVPSAGQVSVDGYSLTLDAARVRRLIGYVAHQPMVYPELSASENLSFFARLYDVPNGPERAEEVLKRVGLESRRDERVRTFSRGMLQRLAIGRALLADPPVLLLDEPDDGLDPEAAEQLPSLIGKGRTTLMISQNLARGLALADRVALLAQGRIVFEASTRNFSLGELEAHYLAHSRGADVAPVAAA